MIQKDKEDKLREAAEAILPVTGLDRHHTDCFEYMLQLAKSEAAREYHQQEPKEVDLDEFQPNQESDSVDLVEFADWILKNYKTLRNSWTDENCRLVISSEKIASEFKQSKTNSDEQPL